MAKPAVKRGTSAQRASYSGREAPRSTLDHEGLCMVWAVCEDDWLRGAAEVACSVDGNDLERCRTGRKSEVGVLCSLDQVAVHDQAIRGHAHVVACFEGQP